MCGGESESRCVFDWNEMNLWLGIEQARLIMAYVCHLNTGVDKT